ncbi:phosphotriesterase [Candidatus Hydrogenedentota bacterium]
MSRIHATFSVAMFLAFGFFLSSAEGAEPQVMTVTGSINASQLGVTLPHEHVLVDFIGADLVDPSRYDQNAAYAVILPYLQQAKTLGVKSFFECTPNYLARDVVLLERLAVATDLNIVTNTGYYGAGANNKFLPSHAFTDTVDELAARWIDEHDNGIEGTGIRPGFIKISVSSGPLSTVHEKLIRAAARAHLATGLTIASHTTDGEAARAQMAILQSEGVDGSAFIWVHAQNESDTLDHRFMALKGAWIEFDNINTNTITSNVQFVQMMKDSGILDHVLLSHDAGWYDVGGVGGASFRGYDTLFTAFIPALQAAGFTTQEIEQLTVDNPRAAFAIGVRVPAPLFLVPGLSVGGVVALITLITAYVVRRIGKKRRSF